VPEELLEEIIEGLSDDDLGLLLLIRHFERKLLDLFDRGLLHGTTHTCLGQEYVPVALAPLLRDDDFVFSNHRGHGHYLARFRDPYGLLAEITGREGAICRGVGGSQHILSGRYLSTGVQGESLPVAAGAALRLRDSEPGALALAYIGDGTWGEGAVYEALNMASLWRLPLVVVTEHNGIAQSTPTATQLAGSIGDRARAFGARFHRTASRDIRGIRTALLPLLDRTRDGGGPLVVEFATHRLGPHSKGDDTRSADSIRAARDHDWYPREGDDVSARFARMDAEARAFVEVVAGEVLDRPPSVWEG
jgi:Pyruvate/2-oxoglutarate dehydrogenase complex, dehydrogenase (E1) component, eukaryotic type, alpha subunit